MTIRYRLVSVPKPSELQYDIIYNSRYSALYQVSFGLAMDVRRPYTMVCRWRMFT